MAQLSEINFEDASCGCRFGSCLIESVEHVFLNAFRNFSFCILQVLTNTFLNTQQNFQIVNFQGKCFHVELTIIASKNHF